VINQRMGRKKETHWDTQNPALSRETGSSWEGMGRERSNAPSRVDGGMLGSPGQRNHAEVPGQGQRRQEKRIQGGERTALCNSATWQAKTRNAVHAPFSARSRDWRENLTKKNVPCCVLNGIERKQIGGGWWAFGTLGAHKGERNQD